MVLRDLDEMIKVCEETLASHKSRLGDLKDLVAQIAKDVGLDAGGLLEAEVDALGKRLEDVRESLATLAEVAETKAANKDLCTEDLLQTKSFLSNVQQAGNRAYYANLPLFQNQLLSRMTKIKVYKTLVRPVVIFGSETWAFTKKDENSLRSFERKILRRIFGPVNDHQGWKIRSNNELLNLIGGQDVVKFMKAQRLRWLGHVNRMPETRTPIKTLKDRLYNRRRRGRPKLKWMDGVSKDLEIMGARGWTNMVKDRVRWKAVVKEAKTHPRL
ncbi:hypothetical protein ANN_22000 [Periplaneta americana]|uniref:Uncharacterized protein n=1 Tax=Periplaneta americana TaxID=6978 RepID=A0ABQ8S7C6_PERAM|nr:hypothetical protein ANN_22000 [Periplaneta americana]